MKYTHSSHRRTVDSVHSLGRANVVKKGKTLLAAASVFALMLQYFAPVLPVVFSSPAPALADSNTVDFESFDLGSINGQDGWSGAVNSSIDQAIVPSSQTDPTAYDYSATFGSQSLRLSNAYANSSFGDWIFAEPLTDAAGEADSTAGSFDPGTLQTHFDASFDIASADPSEQQDGLQISVAPDRGDGSRMSYLRFEDGADGLDVYFDDVTSTTSPAVFNETEIASGLDRSIPHNVELSMDFVDGPSNDVVNVYIDGDLKITGTSWENYYRYDSESSSEQSPRIVRTLLFQARNTAAPATEGKGFLFDNVSLESSTPEPDTGTLVVKKTVSGADVDPSNFSFAIDEGDSQPFSDSADGVSIDLAPGDHTVKEVNLPSDWTASVSCVAGSKPVAAATTESATDGADISIESDQTVTCTFVNTYNPNGNPTTGNLIITKYVCPAGTEFTDAMIPDAATGEATVPETCGVAPDYSFGSKLWTDKAIGDFSGPYASPSDFTDLPGTTDNNGVVEYTLPAGGRTDLAEKVDGAYTYLPSNDSFLAFACPDDQGDTIGAANHTDNYESTFIEAGQTDYCNVYNIGTPPPPTPGDLHLIKVICEAYSDITGNGSADTADNTDGNYTQFANYSATAPHFPATYDLKSIDPNEIPEGCDRAQGWSFKASVDQSQTVGVQTLGPTDSNGEFTININDLNADIKDSLLNKQNGGLMWVSEVTQPETATFGALRCYNDALNGDNLEFISVDPQNLPNDIYCIAYNVKAPETTPCQATDLILNGSFEAPVVENENDWDIFADGTSGLDWHVAWTDADTGAPETANAELHRGVNGWVPEDGAQYTELDSDWGGPSSSQTGEPANVQISQSVDAATNGDYTLTYWSALRPDVDASSSQLEVYWNGTQVSPTATGNTTGTNPVWTEYSVDVTGQAGTDEVAFKEAGTPDSLGTFLDNVSLVQNCDQEPPYEEVKTISGWKWQDQNGDGQWDPVADNHGLANWTFEALDLDTGDVLATDESDADGYYELIFPYSADYKVKVVEVPQDGWVQTYPATPHDYYIVDLAKGQVFKDNDFGNYQKPGDNGNDEDKVISGWKWQDQNGDGVWDQDADTVGLPDWQFVAVEPDPVADLTIDSTSSDEVNTSALPAGDYFIKVSGTWTNRNGHDAVDADYASYDNFATAGFNGDPAWLSDVPGDTADLLDLQLNDSFVDWGDYNTGHEYYQLYTSTGDPISFRIFDGDPTTNTVNPSWYGDNAGSLHVQVYQVASSGVSDADGYYEIPFDSAAQGSVLVFEVPQDGWVQTYPVDTDHYDINLDSGTEFQDNDFGNYQTTPACTEDCDNNGGGGGNNTYTLTIQISNNDGDGDGSVSGTGIDCDSLAAEESETGHDCTETYPAGTAVDLTATPHDGSSFTGSWLQTAGTCTGTTTPCQVTMDSDITLEAHFSDLGQGGTSGGTSGSRVLGSSITPTPTPTPTVLGASIENPNVDGTSIELPRTGTDLALDLLWALLLLALVPGLIKIGKSFRA